MNALSIVAGSIFVVVLLSGLAYTIYKSHQMVKSPNQKKSSKSQQVREIESNEKK